MNLPVSRRDFLGTSAGSAVALTTGPLLAQADALPSQKVTLGIMGLNRGMQVIDALEKQPGVVIKYVCDVDSKRADKAKAQLERNGKQHPQAITDFRRILDDREVDALFCEAPNHWHGPATILACAAGKHVYVEKPCSHNPWEGEQMIAAARKHNRAVQMGVQRRSTPGVMEAMTKLHEGVIGNVYCARSWFNNRPTITGNRQANCPARDARLRTLAGTGPACHMSTTASIITGTGSGTGGMESSVIMGSMLWTCAAGV